MNAAAKVAVRIGPQGSANLITANLFIVTFRVGMRPAWDAVSVLRPRLAEVYPKEAQI